MPALAVILAAGRGTRMKSDLPKVLHPVAGRPMVAHVLDAVRDAGVDRAVVVVGFKADAVRAALADEPGVDFVVQTEQLGTGHAVQQAAPFLNDHDGPVLVVAGDTPLIRGSSLRQLLGTLTANNAACVVGSAVTEDNYGLGRIVREDSAKQPGRFLKIVEERDATDIEKTVTEINTGCYAFDSAALAGSLGQLRSENSQAEYYLTDCPGILLASGETVLAEPAFTIEEAMGVNTPEQLAAVSATYEDRRRGEATLAARRGTRGA
ncbi:MAG: NTP transferase domain-containing protein [Planctomycetota bacterium]